MPIICGIPPLSSDYNGVLQHLSEMNVCNVESLLVAHDIKSKFDSIYLTIYAIPNMFEYLLTNDINTFDIGSLHTNKIIKY